MEVCRKEVKVKHLYHCTYTLAYTVARKQHKSDIIEVLQLTVTVTYVFVHDNPSNGYRFGPKVGQIGTKCDKSGTLKDQVFSTYLRNILKTRLKSP